MRPQAKYQALLRTPRKTQENAVFQATQGEIAGDCKNNLIFSKVSHIL